MLILTREYNQAVVIEGGIRIVVVDIRGHKIKLGITAPGRTIHREEMLDLITYQGGSRSSFEYQHEEEKEI